MRNVSALVTECTFRTGPGCLVQICFWTGAAPALCLLWAWEWCQAVLRDSWGLRLKAECQEPYKSLCRQSNNYFLVFNLRKEFNVQLLKSKDIVTAWETLQMVQIVEARALCQVYHCSPFAIWSCDLLQLFKALWWRVDQEAGEQRRNAVLEIWSHQPLFVWWQTLALLAWDERFQ